MTTEICSDTDSKRTWSGTDKSSRQSGVNDPKNVNHRSSDFEGRRSDDSRKFLKSKSSNASIGDLSRDQLFALAKGHAPAPRTNPGGGDGGTGGRGPPLDADARARTEVMGRKPYQTATAAAWGAGGAVHDRAEKQEFPRRKKSRWDVGAAAQGHDPQLHGQPPCRSSPSFTSFRAALVPRQRRVALCSHDAICAACGTARRTAEPHWLCGIPRDGLLRRRRSLRCRRAGP